MKKSTNSKSVVKVVSPAEAMREKLITLENKKAKVEVEKAAPAKQTKKAAEPGKIFMIAYSDKAVAVFGDTKRIKDQLYEAKGRFNRFLKLHGKPAPGWIFSKTREENVRKIVKLANAS